MGRGASTAANTTSTCSRSSPSATSTWARWRTRASTSSTRLRLADQETATDADFDNIERVVAHEYFHNWSGDRVTCRDWFQLTPEGRASPSSATRVHRPTCTRAAVKRIEDVRAAARRPVPRGRRARWPIRCGPTATSRSPTSTPRPSTRRAPRSSACCTPCSAPEEFREGHRPLFRAPRRPGGDLRGFRARRWRTPRAATSAQFKRWYGQAGTPELKVERELRPGAAGATRSSSASARPPTPGQPEKLPLHIPLRVGLRRPATGARCRCSSRARTSPRAPTACSS